MKQFVYQGKTSAGKVIRGEVEAANEIEARVKLRAQRVIPLKIAEKGTSAASSQSFDLFKVLGLTPKAKAKDLQVFTRQFSTMISSGIPIVQSLEILRQQTISPALRDALIGVKASVEAGKRLADSMEAHPNVFSKLYISMVRAGEEAGALDIILNRLAIYIEKSVKLKNKILSAMWYPLAVTIFSTVVITCLLVFVIPKFEAMFKNVGADLPLPTLYVISASHFMVNNIFFVLLGVAVLGTLIVQYYMTPEGKYQIDNFLLGLPIFGGLIQKGAVARFSRTLSTMLSSGVGIMDALEICTRVVGNAVLERAISRSKRGVAEGKSIVQPLLSEKHIPPMLIQMIGVGEATGRLDTMLGKAADFYEEEVDYAVESLTSIIEPLMMVFLGGLIAILVIAMYLPIFNMAGAVGR